MITFLVIASLLVALLWVWLVDVYCWWVVCRAISEIHLEGCGKIDISSLLMMEIGMVFLAIGYIWGRDEEILANLPSYYRRYIQRVRKTMGDEFWLPEEPNTLLRTSLNLQLLGVLKSRLPQTKSF